MVSAIDAAQKAAKKAIESTYTDTCTILECRESTDAYSGLSDFREEIVAENVPCKLSFERINTITQTETAANITQAAKLFLDPEIKVKAGSKIIIEKEGEKKEYTASGEPAVYSSHQEIVLELLGGWA